LLVRLLQEVELTKWKRAIVRKGNRTDPASPSHEWHFPAVWRQIIPLASLMADLAYFWFEDEEVIDCLKGWQRGTELSQ